MRPDCHGPFVWPRMSHSEGVFVALLHGTVQTPLHAHLSYSQKTILAGISWQIIFLKVVSLSSWVPWALLTGHLCAALLGICHFLWHSTNTDLVR